MLDPFAGSGSTGLAAEHLCRHVTLIDNKPEYIEVITQRLQAVKAVRRQRRFLLHGEETVSIITQDPQLRLIIRENLPACELQLPAKENRNQTP